MYDMPNEEGTIMKIEEHNGVKVEFYNLQTVEGALQILYKHNEWAHKQIAIPISNTFDVGDFSDSSKNNLLRLPFEVTIVNGPGRRWIMSGTDIDVGNNAFPIWIKSNLLNDQRPYIWLHTHQLDEKDVYTDETGVLKLWERDSPSSNDLSTFAIFMGIHAVAFNGGILQYEAPVDVLDEMNQFYLDQGICISSIFSKSRPNLVNIGDLPIYRQIALRNEMTKRYVQKKLSYSDPDISYFLELLNRN